MGSIREIIHTSDDLARQHISYARKIREEPGIVWGIRAVDERIIPSRGGDVSIILGRPGDGKTTVLSYLAAHQARTITGENKEHEETVVFVTWEGTVDTIYAALLASRGAYSSSDYFWGRPDMELIERTAVHDGIMPITFIGFSSYKRTGIKKITLDHVLEAVEAINEGVGVAQRKVVLLLLDYAQLIPVHGTRDRTERTAEAVVGVKNLGMRLDIPAFVGAQAGRQVDSYQIKLAGPADGQHSSQLEQHTDYGYSIWRPIRTEPYDPQTPADMQIYGRTVPLTPNLFLMKNWKQRRDATGFWWPLYMQPEYLNLAEMELRHVEEG